MTDPVARVRRLAAQATAHRRVIWNRLRTEYPEAAADLAALAATFGKPAQTRLWIAGERVWPTPERPKRASTSPSDRPRAEGQGQDREKTTGARGNSGWEKTRPQKASPGAADFHTVKPTFTEPVDPDSIASSVPLRKQPWKQP